MHTGKFVFAQVLDYLPMQNLCRYIDCYYGHHGVKRFSCQDQFESMAFAQLTGRVSLRAIAVCLAAHSKKLFRMGFGAPSIAIP